MSLEAEEILRSAVGHENEGDYQTAFDMYNVALSMLLEDLKIETEEFKKSSLQKIILKYMDVAENLKKQLDATPTPPSLPVSRQTQLETTEESRKAPQESLSSFLFPKKPVPITQPKPNSTSNLKPDNYDYSIPVKVAKKVPLSSSGAPRKPSLSSSKSGTAPGIAAAGAGSVPTPLKAKEEGGKLSEYEEQIKSDMLDASPGVQWADIAGLAFAKQTCMSCLSGLSIFSTLLACPHSMCFYIFFYCGLTQYKRRSFFRTCDRICSLGLGRHPGGSCSSVPQVLILLMSSTS
jgi:hypothetical protein